MISALDTLEPRRAAELKKRRLQPGSPLKEAVLLLQYPTEAARRLFYEGRISERAWDAYCLAARWAAPRFSSMEQEAFFNRHGRRRYYRKIDRVRRAFGLKALDYPPGFFDKH